MVFGLGCCWELVLGGVGGIGVGFGYVGFDCSFLFVSLCLLWYCILVLSGVWLLIWCVSFVLLVSCLLLVGWSLCLDAVLALLIVLDYRFFMVWFCLTAVDFVCVLMFCCLCLIVGFDCGWIWFLVVVGICFVGFLVRVTS